MRGTDTLTVAAPAKVNLFLHVTGRRADGYRTLESLMALIDFADFVTIERRPDGSIVRTRELPGVSADADLTLRAAKLLQDASGSREGVAIAVDKRIPIGGGLGGGSSDAASVLVALDRLWQLAMPRAELAALGARLGADVPFFVHGRHALVRGIGEIVEPVSLPARWLALAIPPVQVSTAAMFAAHELTRAATSAKISVFSESYGSNELERAATSRHPEVRAALATLANARMSGSGACVFATCASEAAAREALRGLPRGVAGRVVRTIARHPLAER